MRHRRTDPRQKRVLARGGFREQWFESAEMSDVAAVLLDTPFVGAAGLGAHEGLRRASPVGDMGHVEPVTFDGPVDVPAALLAEPRHLGAGIGGEVW